MIHPQCIWATTSMVGVADYDATVSKSLAMSGVLAICPIDWRDSVSLVGTARFFSTLLYSTRSHTGSSPVNELQCPDGMCVSRILGMAISRAIVQSSL